MYVILRLKCGNWKKQLKVAHFIGKSSRTGWTNHEFYKFFWEDIKELLFYAIWECFINKDLMPTMKQGLITLIPKPG